MFLKRREFANAASANTNLAAIVANRGDMAEAVKMLKTSLDYLAQEAFDDTEVQTRFLLLTPRRGVVASGTGSCGNGSSVPVEVDSSLGGRKMIFARLVTIFVLLSCVWTLPPVAEPSGKPAADFFGEIHRGSQSYVAERLRGLATCQVAGVECEAGNELLRELFGGTYMDTLPDFIVHLYEDGSDEERTLRSTSVLMFKGRNTPHVFGAEHVWVLVFSKKRYTMSAKVTTTFDRSANLWVSFVSAFGFKGPKPEGKKAESNENNLTWVRITDGEPPYFLGTARLALGPNSVSRITVTFRQPNATLKRTVVINGEPRVTETKHTETTATTQFQKAGEDNFRRVGGESKTADSTTTSQGDKTTTAAVTSETKDTETSHEVPNESGAPTKVMGRKRTTTNTQESTKKIAALTTVTEEISGPAPVNEFAPAHATFTGITGHFGNSRRGRAAFGVGLAATLNVEATSQGFDGSNTHFNAYALGKFYIVRPRIKVRAARNYGSMFRTSYSVVTGTSIGDDSFDEIVVGLSVGHLFGKVGIIVAGNLLPSKRVEQMGMPPLIFERKWRTLVGIEYTF